MKRSSFLVLAAIACGCIVTNSFSQTPMRWIGSDGWGIGTRYEQMFNSYNLQVINGSVYSFDTLTPMQGMSTAIVATIRTENREEIGVILGPSWYILRQDMNLSLNAKVEIRGARFNLNGKNVVSASEVRVTTSGRVLLLRDPDGVPYWCSWRKRK